MMDVLELVRKKFFVTDRAAFLSTVVGIFFSYTGYAATRVLDTFPVGVQEQSPILDDHWSGGRHVVKTDGAFVASNCIPSSSEALETTFFSASPALCLRPVLAHPWQSFPPGRRRSFIAAYQKYRRVYGN